MPVDLLDQFSSTLVKPDVGVVEFCESSDYCGKPLYPRQRTLLKIIFLEELDGYDWDVIREWQADGGETTITPNLEKRMDWLRDNGYPHFNIVQLVGGRRSSKGHLSGGAIAYKVWQLTKLDNVGNHYGIDPNKDVYLSIVADSVDQAKEQQFQDAQNWILDCKPLVDKQLISKVIAETISIYTPYDKQRESMLRTHGVTIDRDLAKIKVRAFGTKSTRVRGQAALLFDFDEMAHFVAGESRMSDDELFKAAEPALAQFGSDAMIFANSSPYTKIGKFYELYVRSMEVQNDVPIYPTQFMLQFPSWELYKDWEKDETHKWRNAVILDPKYEPEGIIAQSERADPEAAKVEYRAQFAEVVDAFLNPNMVDRMYDSEWNKRILGFTPTEQYGARSFFTYAGHGDPSSTTANFGLAVGHLVEIRNPETEIIEPHVVFDYINAYYPEDFDDHTIDWLEVLPDIVELINRFRPFEFTFDQFDSTAPIQILNKEIAKLGMQSTRVAVKTATPQANDRRNRNFKAALNLGRVHAPHWEMAPAEKSIELSNLELKFLQEKNGRVNKQTIGPVRTKDIADCIMEVVDKLIGDHIASMNALGDQQIATGAHHGYAVGGYTQESPFDNFYDIYRASQSFNPARGMQHRGQRR